MKHKDIQGTNTIDIEGDINELDTSNKIEGYEYGASMSTEGVRLEDPGTGKTNTIRVFEFKMNPDPMIRKNFPDTQTLFNAHAKQIMTILWGDGLRPLEGVPPRVIINKKTRSYQIFVPAEANNANTFNEKPLALNKQLNGTR